MSDCAIMIQYVVIDPLGLFTYISILVVYKPMLGTKSDLTRD